MKLTLLPWLRPLLAIPLAAVILIPGRAHGEFSAAREWNEQLLAGIRRNVPNPPAHARNLFHTAVAMYNAWAAYDPVAAGYVYNEKISPLPFDVESARREAISYAAHRVLKSRFAAGAGSGVTSPGLDAKLTAMGYSTATASGPLTSLTTPAELGKRVGAAILSWGAADGFANTTYPQVYDYQVNPNLLFPLSVLGTNGSFLGNMPLGYGIPSNTDPNFWQPLDLSTSITQNGIPIPGGAQSFLGVQSLATTPFSLTREDPLRAWIDPFGGPSKLSTPGNPSDSDAIYKEGALDVIRASSQLNDTTPVDISPGSIGNNPLGSDAGTGFPVNPLTSQPWAPDVVKRGDFVRVLAEFWADGPNSETPPGHWHVLANQVSEMPLLQKRIRGTGPFVNDLEWDIKAYFAVAAATHDAACAAWALKRYYSGTRPITMIRYLGSRGQSSDPGGPSYDPQGLPLETGVCELITSATTGAGGKHAQIWDVRYGSYFPGSFYLNQVAVYSWPGEHPNNPAAPGIATTQSTVRWMLAKDWLPFQRKTFNTPAFPGYISGHSTFSRAAAEALTLLTGSHLFPGGFHHHRVAANSLQIDLGPSTPVDLQWCSFYDAADQAGQSRRWGGIHVSEDDYHGRVVGSMAGKSAFALAERYWTGSILHDTVQPSLKMQPDGTVLVSWPAARGMTYRVQTSSSLQAASWIDAGAPAITYDTRGSWFDASPDPGRKFYRVVRVSVP